MTLTDKQTRFIEEYMIDSNATQAAIRAGYSEKTAQEQSSRLLSNVMVKREIEERQRKLASKYEGLRERIIDEYIKIAFADIRSVSSWNDKAVSVKTSDKIDNHTSAAISEVTTTNTGIKVKMYDKRAALMDLAKMMGFITDKQEIAGVGNEPLQINRIEHVIITPKQASKAYIDMISNHK